MSPPQKKQKLSHKQNDNEDTVAGPSNAESSPKIFKLNNHCFNEIFEYLSLKDLHSFGQTCKRMNKVAGEYFKQNYLSAKNLCADDGIYTFYSDNNGVMNVRTQTSGFSRFTSSILHSNDDLGPLHYIESHITEFESINHIHLWGLIINNEKVKMIKELLAQLEILQIFCCSIDGDFYDVILKECDNLKQIFIRVSNTANPMYGTENWLLHEYPKLEHLLLMPNESHRIGELSGFFGLNPNVQRFSTTSDCLWNNRDIVLESNVELEILEVKAGTSNGWFRSEQSKEILDLLNQLHERGFYKRVFINVAKIDNDLSTMLISLKGLESISIGYFEESHNLPQLTNLKELIILNGSNTANFEMLASSLEKLERLHIGTVSIDHVTPFIRRSPKLNKIRVSQPNFKTSFNGGALNLRTLNEERAKLNGARKLTIYVHDNVFLKTKWSTKNGDTNLSSIEMRRLDSSEWHHRGYEI